MLWRYIENDSVSASFGLAADEYLVDTFTAGSAGKTGHSGYGRILRLYTYRDHCAILGRFQDTESEINLPECKKLGIEVNRRITGGGTIIMGHDQLGVAIVVPPGDADAAGNSSHFSTKKIFEDYSRGIIKALSLLGIQSEFRPKNDILVAGKKIAGLAACVQENGNALFHASILLDIDTGLMANVLRIPFEKISDKEISEVEERITTVKRESKESVTNDRLKETLRTGFENEFQMKLQDMPLTGPEISGIELLQEKKYSTNEWIYQKSLIPGKTTVIRKKTKAGMINVHMVVMNNIIKDIIITGDFFSTTEFVSNLERRLRSKIIDKEVITKAVDDAWLSSPDPISGLRPDVLVDCILER